MALRIPVSIAIGVAAVVALIMADLPPRRAASHDDRQRRQLRAARRSLLRPRRQPDERHRHHRAHLRLRPGALRRLPRRPRPCQRGGQHDLRRNVGGGSRRPGWSRRGGNAGHAPERLSRRLLGRRDPGVVHHRAHHSAEHRVGGLRPRHRHVGGAPVPGRHPSRRHDRPCHHGLHFLLRTVQADNLGPAGTVSIRRVLAHLPPRPPWR